MSHTRPDDCKAYRDRTGDYVCNRCGLQWDGNDEPPGCRTWDEIKQDKQHVKKSSLSYGRSVINQLKEGLKK